MPSSHVLSTSTIAPTAAPTLALSLALLSLLSGIATPSRHALLIQAVSWLALCLCATLLAGIPSLARATHAQRLACTAGILLALAQLCERAVSGKSIWWAKALPPILLYTLSRAGILTHPSRLLESPPASPTKTVSTPERTSYSTLIIATASGLTALVTARSASVIALGLSYAVLGVLGYHLVYQAKLQAQDGTSVIYSASGLLTQPSHPAASRQEQYSSIVRDVSGGAAIVATFSALTLETVSLGGLAQDALSTDALRDQWIASHAILSLVNVLGTVLLHMTTSSMLILMLQRHGPFVTSFIPLSAALSSQLWLAFSWSRLWFAALCGGAAFAFLDDQDSTFASSRMRLRAVRLLTLVASLSFAGLAVFQLRRSWHLSAAPRATSDARGLEFLSPKEPLSPLRYAATQVHPIAHLVTGAQSVWDSQMKAQSQTLEAAVLEYKRRYGMSPPPHFDKWFEFAKQKGVQMIDEYDSLYHSLLPFWALSPATIRARTREAIGFGDNQLMGVLIRDGKAVHVEAGPEWLQQAAVGMMEQFIEHLPDMDLAFNIHDEPRVVVPHDELSRLIETALTESIPAANAHSTPTNSFSQRPRDMTSGQRILEVKTTRFSHYAHQATWIPSRLSCSADSPARTLDDLFARDNLTAYALGELGFLYNQTAFSDICNSPSLSSTHGFFDRPNAFNVVHQLFPVFSQSKISSFQDILYPSPWYWYGKVEYKDGRDMAWEQKQNKLWWRGSTTGGFSRAGGWKRQHRQHFVRRVNALDSAQIMAKSNAAATDSEPTAVEYIVKDIDRQDMKEIMDVHFSHVGQCDPGDCDAQREFFNIVEPADQQDAWNYKYLLDMDGNAFSGRFYAFLASRSLPFKMAIFREWHEEWIRPWVHYVPLSLNATEALEAVRFLDAEEDGRQIASSLAEAGRQWAGKALRNEDFEAWLFRLMLEYGRIIDDDRASIGFAL